jgi:uncharacterized Fe-S center protein
MHNLGYLGLAREQRHVITHRSGVPEPAGVAGAVALGGDLVASDAAEARDTPLHLAPAEVQERMVEALAAIVSGKPGRCAYLNIMLDITPDPDGHPWSDAPIVPDVGILASRDPVALDQACIDHLNGQEGIAATRLSHPGVRDKLADLNPDVDWSSGLAYAERLGLGSRDYELLII